MRPIASINLENLGALFGWLLAQWWVYVAVGVIVIVVLVVMFMPTPKVKPSSGFPTTGTEANELALGFLQIRSDPAGAWNDPTASHLNQQDEKMLLDQWGIPTRKDWDEAIEGLLNARRRRDVWQVYLGIRAEMAGRLGRAPQTKEWLAGIVEAGGSGKREDKRFVSAVEYLERRVRKTAGREALPASVMCTSFDGYAFGQAVALATWGVALGYVTEEEARQTIHRINEVARPAFGSWAEFGLSYVAGRLMHWTDGSINDKSYEKLDGPVRELKSACSAKLDGPWATLQWQL